MAKYVAQFEAGRALDPKDFRKDLSSEELCQVFGACQRFVPADAAAAWKREYEYVLEHPDDYPVNSAAQYTPGGASKYAIVEATGGGTPELLSTVPATTLTATAPNGAANSAIGAGFNQVFRVVAVSSTSPQLLSNSNTTSVDFANAVSTYNIITPNGDGKNDVLVFDNITLYPGNSLTIYNRWGREVYNTTNYRNTWGGEGLSGGTYYYLLKLPNGTSTKSWFEIVK